MRCILPEILGLVGVPTRLPALEKDHIWGPSLWSDIIIEWEPPWLERFLDFSQTVPVIRFLGYLKPAHWPSSRLRGIPKLSDIERAGMISLVAEKECILSSALPLPRPF